MSFLTCTMPVQSPLCGPKAPTKSWPASPASPSARQMPRPHNLCHEPLLQDTSQALNSSSRLKRTLSAPVMTYDVDESMNSAYRSSCAFTDSSTRAWIVTVFGCFGGALMIAILSFCSSLAVLYYELSYHSVSAAARLVFFPRDFSHSPVVHLPIFLRPTLAAR